MDIESVTKIHTEPGDILFVVIEQANIEEAKRLALLIKERLDRVLVIITDKPIDAHRLSAEQLREIFGKLK